MNAGLDGETGAGRCIVRAVRETNSLTVNAGSDGERGAGRCIGGIWTAPYGDVIF